MEIYNKKISDYLSKRDTDLKRLIHSKKNESPYSSEVFIDDLLFRCGLISTNVVTILESNKKYHAYISCQEENIFNQKKGITELVEKPVSYSKAQVILANKITDLLENVNYEQFSKKVSN